MKCIKAALLATVFFLTACTTANIDKAADYHEKAAPHVQLGMSEGSFVKLMEPALDASTSGETGRKPKRYSRNDDMYVTYYIRSNRVPDGLSTDDEFQPYTFENGRLIAVLRYQPFWISKACFTNPDKPS